MLAGRLGREVHLQGASRVLNARGIERCCAIGGQLFGIWMRLDLSTLYQDGVDRVARYPVTDGDLLGPCARYDHASSCYLWCSDLASHQRPLRGVLEADEDIEIASHLTSQEPLRAYKSPRVSETAHVRHEHGTL